jgi:hypothetical protein
MKEYYMAYGDLFSNLRRNISLNFIEVSNEILKDLAVIYSGIREGHIIHKKGLLNCC